MVAGGRAGRGDRADRRLPRARRSSPRWRAGWRWSSTATASAGAAMQARLAISILERSDELRDDPRAARLGALGPLFLREAEAGRVADRPGARAGPHRGRGRGAADHPPAHRARPGDHRPVGGGGGQATTRRSGWRAETGQRVRAGRGDSPGSRGCRPARAARRRAARTRRRPPELCAELGIGRLRVWAIQALGDLELGLGRAGAAAVHHEAQAAALRRARHRRRRPLARAGAGRRLPAPRAAPTTRRRRGRRSWPPPRPRASRGRWPAAMRCRGLLADDGRLAGARSSEALALHAHTPDVFEAARTRLAYGARLRRARQRVRAREQLRAALDLFERLGARPWADQARQSWPPPARRPAAATPSTLDDLTPQELQIARLLAERHDHARGGRGGLPQPEDGRVPPAQRLPQARHPLARGARRGAEDRGGGA